MSGHRLGLDIYETSNEGILKISDISIYDTILPVVCPQLLITSPGFQFSASIDQSRLIGGFNLVLTACDLELQTQACDSRFDTIPDGIYAIRYSVSPSEYVFVEYNHLRLTKEFNRLNKVYCSLDADTCQLDKVKSDKLSKILEVESYLKSARASVEICNKPERGMKQYEYAKKLLDKLDCKHCG